MVTIDCGPDRIYNPDTGRCIKADGITAKKLVERLRTSSQRGDCDGTILQTPKGVPYCSKKATLVERAKRTKRGSTVAVAPPTNEAVVVDTRIARALREVRKLLLRKNRRIRQLQQQIRTSKAKMESLARGLRACKRSRASKK